MDLKHIPTGQIFRIAKFYYPVGWYVNVETDEDKIDFVNRLNAWLDLHVKTSDDLFNAGANYVLEYEVGDPENAEVQEDAIANK